MTGSTWNIVSTTFAGHFDGRGYTITAQCPFLGIIGENGTVQGLNYVCTELATRSIFCAANKGTIQNCFVKGDADGGSTVGLLCGTNNGVITNCGAMGDVKASGDDCSSYAGMIAENSSGTVSNCYAAVTARASSSGKYTSSYEGPVVGKVNNVSAVSSCVYDSTLYTYSYQYATGMSTEEMKNGAAMRYVVGLSTDQCGWTMDSTFDGYPHLIHLAHTYTAYVTNYQDEDVVVYNGTQRSVTLSKASTAGSIYYTTDSSVTDPAQFTQYTGSFNIYGDTTITMAVKYNGQFGTLTRQRFIGLPGYGTAGNPYKISQNYQLWLPNMFPTAYFVLTDNLTFTDSDFAQGALYSGGWIPIESFSGNFDGQGYAISGLQGSWGGLFESNYGTIQNLRIIDHRLTGPGYVGAVADNNRGGTISRCYTKSAYTLSSLPAKNSIMSAVDAERFSVTAKELKKSRIRAV